MSRFKSLGMSTILATAFATVTWAQHLPILSVDFSSQHAQRTWDHVWDNSGMSGDSGPGTNVMNDLHDQSVDANFAMWSQGSPPPHTATFDMGQSYELDEFWLWNDNESTWYIQGIKEVTIEIREFGKPFTTVFGPADVPSAQQAGAAASGPDLFIDLAGITGRFFRITTGAAEDHSWWEFFDGGPAGPGSTNADAAINEIRLYGDTNGLGNASTEACCFPDGSCTNLLAGDCTTAGGLSEGPGTECATAVCALPEACCFIDGTCADMDPVACATASGTAEGVGTDCGTFSCPQPAPVFAVGDPAVSNGWSSLAGIANITVDSFNNGGSDFMLDGSGITGLLGEFHTGVLGTPATMWRSAGPFSNNQFNAGTVVGGHYAAIEFNKIENLLSIQVWNYNENGANVWAAHGMKEVTIEVSTTGGGTSNQWTTVFDGAIPLAAQALDYAGTNVPIGGVDAKFVVITSDEGVEGSYMNDFFPGLGNTDTGLSELRFLIPEPTNAPPEACCMTDGSCADLDPGDCNAAGGIAQGVGTICATTVCPGPEACCFDDGSCTDVLASICTNTVGLVEVGVPQGNGTSCATAACPQPEACCLSDDTCVELLPSLCTAAAGVSQGTGTICAELSCVIITETVLTNGVEVVIADRASVRYDLEKATSLNPNWTDLPGYVVGDGGQAILVGPDTDPHAFYRLNIDGPVPAVGSPGPANGWSSLSGIANITVDAFNNGGNDFILNGSGISGPNGEFHTGDLGNPSGPYTMWNTGASIGTGNQFNAGTAVGAHYAAVEFNQIETLDTLQIWNYNENGGAAWAAQGMKEVTIEYSTTGGPTSNEWTTIYDGPIAYAGNPTLPSFDVPFGGVDARFVVITNDEGTDGNYWTDHFGGFNDGTGLSELRFLVSDDPAIPIDTVAVNDPTGFSFSSASGTIYELERAFKFPPEPIGGAGVSNGWDQTAAITNVVASSEETGIFNGTAVQTVNGAGVSADGSTHGEVAADNIFWWTQAAGAPARGGTVTGEQWVEYQFDQVYTLASIQIWNYNEAGSDLTRYGISNATIQVSTTGSGDPGDWTTVFSGTIPEAGGSATEPVSLEINTGNVPATHVVITAHSHHGDPFSLGAQVQGLSEVRLNAERTVPISVLDAEFEGTGAFTVGDGDPRSLFDPNGFSTDYFYRIMPRTVLDSNPGVVTSVVTSVEAVGFEEKTIYHSPETPGYTSWVGLWQIPDGRLRVGFLQLTGPVGNIVSQTPNMESVDGGETWNMLPLPPTDFESGRGMAVMSDGTLVRPVQISEAAGYVSRSVDGGTTWSDPIYLLPSDTTYQVWPAMLRPLRDGRLVLFAAVWLRDDVAVGGVLLPYPHSRKRKMMFISSDKGLTWSSPIELMSLEDGVSEESDFCELPNGDLFWVHRCEIFPGELTEIPPGAARMGSNPANPWTWFYSDRKQSITRREGDTFVPEMPELMKGVPHSGYPMVLYTQEGLILNFQRDAIYWTADLGENWEKLNANISTTTWYPRALQLADGKIIVVSHVGLDDEYGTVDQSIIQQTFRLEVVR